MHVIESFDENNIAYDFDFCVCGKYLVIKTPINIKAFIQVCKKRGYPISVKKADNAYMITDKKKKT